MSLLLTNECTITGCGYIISECEIDSHIPTEDRRLLVTLWVKDKQIPALKRVFNSQESLYRLMQIFVKSPLADYLEIHRSKAFMGREFIQYYEQNMTNPKIRIVT